MGGREVISPYSRVASVNSDNLPPRASFRMLVKLLAVSEQRTNDPAAAYCECSTKDDVTVQRWHEAFNRQVPGRR